jgi:hypothetical protein
MSDWLISVGNALPFQREMHEPLMLAEMVVLELWVTQFLVSWTLRAWKAAFKWWRVKK